MRILVSALALSTGLLLASASTQAHTQPKVPAEVKQELHPKMPVAITCEKFARPDLRPVSVTSLPVLLELKRAAADSVAKPTREVPQRERPGYPTTTVVPPDFSYNS